MRIFVFFALVLISGCAGFYTENKGEMPAPIITKNEIFVNVKVNFKEDEKLFDEIATESDFGLSQRSKKIKDDLFKYLFELSNGKIIESRSRHDNGGCVLDIYIRENYSVKDTVPTALTLGLWPYLGDRKIFLKSSLKQDSKIVQETQGFNSYKAGFSIFFIPLAPFKTINDAGRRAYRDLYAEEFGKINFNECSK